MSQPANPGHPYFPQDAAIPQYVANTASLAVILRGFIGMIVVFVSSGLYVGKKINPALRANDLIAMAWFLLCFFLHAFFEGYFVLYHDTLSGSQTLFSQLWKEYALSDSRYMTSDPFMLCIESLTVLIWAPLCLAIAICIVSRSRMRYPLQIIMCVGHLFGVALYYGTCYFEYHHNGVSHSRPEFLYYWVYYLGLNAAWFVVPAVYLVDSFRGIFIAWEEPETLNKRLNRLQQLVVENKRRDREHREETEELNRSLTGIEQNFAI